jgi:hypothetical protein
MTRFSIRGLIAFVFLGTSGAGYCGEETRTPDSAGARVVRKAKAKFVVDRSGIIVEARLPKVPK